MELQPRINHIKLSKLQDLLQSIALIVVLWPPNGPRPWLHNDRIYSGLCFLLQTCSRIGDMAHYGAIVEGQDIQFILGDHSQGGGKWLQCSLDSELELPTNFRKVLQCPEKAPTKTFSLLKAL